MAIQKVDDPKEKLTKTISIRVTQEEYDAWKNNPTNRENLSRFLRVTLKNI